MKFEKNRPQSDETEVEKIKRLFPAYDTTPLAAVTDHKGNFVSIETEDPDLIAVLRANGFIEH